MTKKAKPAQSCPRNFFSRTASNPTQRLCLYGVQFMKREKETFTRTIATKLTETEWKNVERSCSETGMTKSEYCRKALLTQLNFTKSNDSSPTVPPTETALLLAEVLALRTITVNLLHSIGSGESVSRDQVRNLIELADREKLRRAVERLHDLSKTV